MSYERKQLQLLGGSFNLLPPGDKIPRTDYLLAQNWRPDSAGRLVSRWGFTPGASFPSAAYLNSAALHGNNLSGAYWGAWLTTEATGAVFLGADTTPVATGFDGAPLGMVPMNGWMWIMNRALRGRHSRTQGWKNWGIAPPTAPCSLGIGGVVDSGPNGTYKVYVTFAASDDSVESNGGPASAEVTVSNAEISVTNIPVSPDPQVGKRNLYLTGGTLGDAYRFLSIPDNSTTYALITLGDREATYNGITMPRNHDLPPAARGLAGPYYRRLFAFASAEHPNRMWWTEPDQPQYWPGAYDPGTGNYQDVGADGEAILGYTIHPGVLVIYKERSVWRLVGPPDTGTLEQLSVSVGLTSARGLVNAGACDYFKGPQGIYRCDLDHVEEISTALRPLFTSFRLRQNTGALDVPGGMVSVMLPGGTQVIEDFTLGYALGKLYVTYLENTASAPLPILVFHEQTGRWFYYRSAALPSTGWITGFLFDGFSMWACGGDGTKGVAYNVDDCLALNTVDASSHPIECVYQSHYEDCGDPDTPKVYLEVVIDYELYASDTATVLVGFDGGKTPLKAIGTIAGSGRQSIGFALGTDSQSGAVVLKTPLSPDTVSDGFEAKNFSVAIDAIVRNQAVIHNVYLYYYVEARLATEISSIPTDLGSAKVKQCKELQLDIDAPAGTATAKLSSDLPGNALAVRETMAVAKSGRAPRKYPFAVREGFLWKLGLGGGPFRLYNARLLMREIGVYVEAYEAAAGFVWDSMEFRPGGEAANIAQAREITVEIETFGGDVTVDLWTDLPGNAQASRFTRKINTATAGNRFVRIPLSEGIEGRIYRLRLSGVAKFILYSAAIEVLLVGVYIEAYEGAGGAVYDSRAIDLGTSKPKEARELELDVDTSGADVKLCSDLPGYTLAQVFRNTAVSTSGRQRVPLPLTGDALRSLYPMGRLYRLLISGPNAIRLYGARLLVREFGCYLVGDEAGANPAGVWDSTPLDLGTEREKAVKRLVFDIQTDGPVLVRVLADQGGAVLTQQFSTVINTSGSRLPVKIPLPPGIRGRLLQVLVSGNGVRLFAGRVWWRPLNESGAGWSWAELPIPATTPLWSWVPFPVLPTDAQWSWHKLLTVEETAGVWRWVDIPMGLAG